MQEMIRDNTQDTIIHLHGHYKDVDSVVLGITSYNNLLQRPFFKHIEQAVYHTKHILFYGFGAGFEDPHFDELLKWANTAPTEHSHYRLVPKEEETTANADVRIRNIVYGEKHADIIPFLEQLLKDIHHAS